MDTRLALLTDYMQVKGFPKSTAPLLHELLKVTSGDGRIVVNAALKREISGKIQISVGSIDNLISKMSEERLLIRVDRGMYEPISELKNLFQKSNIIGMSIIYSDDEKQITIQGGKIK
ncbi:MAG: hypothetical protein PWR19_788 [Carnobacterium sp.]|uniref:hypothetical protein n=1 Tax=Carnobacterium sp. TaxID=48221 RepID=UPI0026479795|nr:hypothetical protein [Carnobacterium sp.]MDN5371742.1 hypothetical protein [Carnobacterium sp.]